MLENRHVDERGHGSLGVEDFRDLIFWAIPDFLYLFVNLGARPTYEGGDALLSQAADDLDDYARRWGELADAGWVAEGSADLENADRLRMAQ